MTQCTEHRPVAPQSQVHQLRRCVARAAVRALYAEVALEPKPGLVSFRDNGSHTDMDASTFVRSLFSLRHYFADMAQAGYEQQPFGALQTLGRAAEQRMLRATQGINTHRGAIFALGLLCASAGLAVARGLRARPETLRELLRSTWGPALLAHAEVARALPARSNGQRAARKFGLRSAAQEAAEGFPILFETTLPALQQALQQGHMARAARVQAYFATMAALDDTNVAHRGGWEGVCRVKALASDFLLAGGVQQTGWLQQARKVHAELVQRRLSPGGCADMLACACWMQDVLPALG
jgi:triphosphoribosyl-dephospho-CoA synthase